MSEEVQAATAEAESPSAEKRNLNISMPHVLNLACTIIHRSFFKQDKIKTKALLKELKAGKKISMGSINVSPKSEENAGEVPELKIPISMALDYSEFCGGFNRPDFLEALAQTLNHIGKTLNAKKNLNVMTDQNTGTMLVHLPGFIEKDGQLNVMNMVIDQDPKGGMIFKMAFFNPEQYIQAAKDASPEDEQA